MYSTQFDNLINVIVKNETSYVFYRQEKLNIYMTLKREERRERNYAKG